MDALFIAHLFASFFLCGLIWIVQLVHYPAFRFVEQGDFVKFEEFHTRNISFIVVPVMILELASAFLLFKNSVDHSNLLAINLLLAVLVWIVTFVFSVPCHMKLAREKDLKSINLLVRTNWLRTFIWTAKSVLLIYITSLIYILR